LFQYDYLVLSALLADLENLIAEIPPSTGPRRALDLGSDTSPYAGVLAARGFSVETLDVPGAGADHAGTAEATGLPDASYDLVLCTQVLEHCIDPFRAVREIRRILRPGGYFLASVPHVWFFHPHPTDHWRFTQQGLARLCDDGGLAVRSLTAQGGTLLATAQIANFLVYGVLGTAGAPLYALINLIGRRLDWLVRNELFCINFACLARRD
jgi:SAM-dependent methyltransferase